MKYGICTKAENWPLVDELGFDYIELPCNWIATISEEAFSALLEESRARRTKALRCSLLYPKTLQVVGPQRASDEEILAYAEKAMSRMERLGVECVVFGSGKSRMVPEGYPLESAFAECVAITKKVAQVASRHHITIALEVLNTAETNLINTLPEGQRLVDAVAEPNVQMLVDMFHMVKEQEAWDHIAQLGTICHTHIALREGRAYPLTADDDVVSFFSQLEKKGYNGTMSIEGKSENMREDGAVALSVLRRIHA